MKGGFLTYASKFKNSSNAYKSFIKKCKLHILANGTFGLTFTCEYMGRGNSPYISIRDGIEKPVKKIVIKLGAISIDENSHKWLHSKLSNIDSIYTITKKDFDNEIEIQDKLVNNTLEYYSAICLTPVYSKIYEHHEVHELIDFLKQTDEVLIQHVVDEIKMSHDSPLWKYTIIAMEYGDNMTTVLNIVSSNKKKKTKIYAAIFLKMLELFLLGYIHTDLHLSNAMIKYDEQLQIYRVWIIDMARVFPIEIRDIITNNPKINNFVNIYQKDELVNLGYDNCLEIINGIYDDSFFNIGGGWIFKKYRVIDNMQVLSYYPDLYDWIQKEFTKEVYLQMIVCANKEIERRAKFSNDIVINRIGHKKYKSKNSKVHMIRRDDIPILLKKYSKRNRPVLNKYINFNS